jgi:pimeloyl-ACP methyl ester carboxylesterase
MNEFDLDVDAGRTIHVYDLGGEGFPVVWHHGTPNIGTPPAPLYGLAKRLGLRWVSFDRPGYGGSTRLVGRSVGSVAGDTQAVADALGLSRFAVMGQSGGGTYALGCGAALSSRVSAVVSLSGLAPFSAEGLDWYGGMIPSGRTALHGSKDQVIPVSHARWLAAHCPTAELRVKEGESHLSIITHAAEGLEWLAHQVHR